MREIETERHRETQRDTDRQALRQTDRQTHTDRDSVITVKLTDGAGPSRVSWFCVYISFQDYKGSGSFLSPE